MDQGETSEAIEERERFLKQATPLASLPDDLLRLTAAALRPRDFAPGEVIVRAGEPGRALYVLARGGAEVRVRTESGGTATVVRMGRGECFGEMSLLSGDEASADVLAGEGASCLVLEREAFERLVLANPGLLRAFVRLVTRRLHSTTAAMATAREKGEQLTRFLREADVSDLELLGRDRTMQALEAAALALASRDEPVLIQGERGTGKELLARLMHFRGARREGPLLCVDCGEITATQWGDHLFGPRGRSADKTGVVSYVDLAVGGTLLLKNLERLPPAVAERLARFLAGGELPADERPDVRIVATIANSVPVRDPSVALAPELARCFSAAALQVPPLRERKRDLPAIATRLLARHAERHRKALRAIDGAGISKLVSHDYLSGNVRELEEVIERAVILAEGATIKAEEIFLGLPPRDEGWRFNLLRLPPRLVGLALRLYPRPLRAAAALALLGIVLACFLGPADPRQNIGTILGWGLWWPAMALSFVFAGRSWCAVCPLSVPGSLAQRFVYLRLAIPGWLKERGNRIAMAGFFLIVLVEELTAMRESPRATGILLLVIVGLALLTSVLFPRRTWCLHLCPLGGLAGVGATGAVLELRPTPDICAAQCHDHTCYKGNDRISGCPMFQHLMFVDSSRDCVLCLDCVRSCPNGSPQLNLRAPARELRAPRGRAAGTDEFTMMLGGIVAALLGLRFLDERVVGVWADATASVGRGPLVSLLLFAGAALPLLARLVWRRLRNDQAAVARFDRTVAAWLPVVGAAFAALQLSFVPGLPSLLVSVRRTAHPSAGLTFGLLATLQVAAMVAGASVSGYTLHRLARQAPAGGRWRGPVQQGVLLAAAALTLGLLLA
jgi:transcriptional regulator with AAA-type ATPase domain/polyferredoxin